MPDRVLPQDSNENVPAILILEGDIIVLNALAHSKKSIVILPAPNRLGTCSPGHRERSANRPPCV